MIYFSGNRHLLRATRSLLEAGYVGMLLTDKQGTIISSNESIAAILGTEPQALYEQPLASHLGDPLWSLLTSNLDKLHAGETLSMEFELEVEGRTRTLLGLGQLVKRRLGPRRYLVQIIDQTAQHLAKRALSNATDQMRRILATSTDMVFIVDRKLNITFGNETVFQVLDTSTAILAGQPFYQLLKAEDRKACMRALELLTRQQRNEINVGSITLSASKEVKVDLRFVRLAAGQGSNFAIICQPEQTLAAAQQEQTANARFSQVFHGSPDAIMILRAHDSVILDFNEGFHRLLGYSREEAIGESGVEANFWTSISERDEVIAHLRQNREVIDYETTLRSKSGRQVHVEISLRYITVDDELCILCIGRDITKRISAEAALYETEEKFKKVFTQSPDGIVIIRQADGAIADVNDAFINRSGWTREEYIGHDFMEFLDTSHESDVEELTRNLATERTLVNQFICFKTKDGAEVPSLISATVLELRGEPHTMVIAKDISKQRSTEERLRRSEERFRGIFENAPIGILLVDMDGRIFQANYTAATMLAYDEAEMSQMHISRLVPDSERRSLKESLAELVGGDYQTHKSERRLSCRDGLELWSNVNIVLQKSSDGAPLYYIVQIADISDIKRGQAKMERLAFYDTLTNLANRRLFQDRLEQTIERCQRYGRSSALLYLDLDNFKRVNDTLGHQTGDSLLREVAARISACVRKEDTVGRTGGDEFTILLNEVNTPADAGMIAEKILQSLREPIIIAKHPLVITTSIGITVIPGDGHSANILMGNADLAMYKAKERGRNNYQYYSDDLNANAANRLRTEYELRQAIENNEFELYYQPKICLRTHQIVGVESLIRWNHPSRGLLAPDQFIEIAEDTGSIIDIGSWVVEEACRASNHIANVTGSPLVVAINISPRQFRDPTLVATMRRCIREQALDPAQLEIEITETMLMHDVSAAQATVEKLSQLGVKLAIDDFGTGYSSLNYLRRFPINTVKIDRSFVMDLPTNTDDLAITKAVIAMAHQLKMEVVAEGVETKAQMDFLVQENCEYAQGYLFSKAIRLEQIVALLQNKTPVIHNV